MTGTLMFDLSVDVDECQTGEHNCSHNCSNTLGSFECKCKDGYSLQGDRTTCAGMHAFMSAYVYVWVSVCACVSVCVRVCIHACMRVCCELC